MEKEKKKEIFNKLAKALVTARKLDEEIQKVFGEPNDESRVAEIEGGIEDAIEALFNIPEDVIMNVFCEDDGEDEESKKELDSAYLREYGEGYEERIYSHEIVFGAFYDFLNKKSKKEEDYDNLFNFFQKEEEKTVGIKKRQQEYANNLKKTI